MLPPDFRVDSSSRMKIVSWIFMVFLVAITVYSCERISASKRKIKDSGAYTVVERIEVKGKCREAHVTAEISETDNEYFGQLIAILYEKDGAVKRSGSVNHRPSSLPKPVDSEALLYGVRYVPPPSIDFRFVDELTWAKQHMTLRGVTTDSGQRQFQAECILDVVERKKIDEASKSEK